MKRVWLEELAGLLGFLERASPFGDDESRRKLEEAVKEQQANPFRTSTFLWTRQARRGRALP